MAQTSALDDTLADAMNDEVDIDFSGASEGAGPWPIGTPLLARITKAEVGKNGDQASEPGAPNIKIEWKQLEGGKVVGWPLRATLQVRGPGSGFLRDVLTATGKTPVAGTKLKASALVGAEAMVTAKYQKGSSADGETTWQEVARVAPKAGAAKKAAGTKAAAPKRGL